MDGVRRWRQLPGVPTTPALFYRITEGIRITARPSWLPGDSDLASRRFVFGYRIRIENTSPRGVQLLSRRWRIHDDGGDDQVVEGDGVVGQQPHIAPGHVHEYASYCVLGSESGWMEGSYHFVADDGTRFDATIPRFLLSVGTGDV